MTLYPVMQADTNQVTYIRTAPGQVVTMPDVPGRWVSDSLWEQLMRTKAGLPNIKVPEVAGEVSNQILIEPTNTSNLLTF